ncbi:heparin-sulfate lyase [Flavobacteriaceae bacterium UJ101]|nr:heparin-sulfate lyase [Flavobacteriaceae bacterium UJ101]
MFSKINSLIDVISNMGLRYVGFRSWYELKRKTGVLQKEFPINPPFQKFITLLEWKNSKTQFFFSSKENLVFPKVEMEKLKKEYEKINKGIYTYFSALDFDLGENYNWLTNPDTGYEYDISRHSLSLENLNADAGDIKYVWEKARFSFLYTIIRYDYHYQKDCSKQVFQEILDFIDKNPINQGPNYNCSQETSIRVFNWIFALNYYKNSEYLTDIIFEKIMNSIYWQIHHVYHNIHFSRIAVRNNHAITETLALYLIPLLFPTIPNAKKWKKLGKKWFEQEIKYQIYEDGTFLQFSMNYHRVVIQLLTWGIQLAHLNNEKFDSIVYKRAKKSVEFLNTCQDDSTGWLPNYGANDGALFFKLSNTDYRNYKAQLYALASLLNIEFKGTISNEEKEDANWYHIQSKAKLIPFDKSNKFIFKNSGYYIIRENDVITFLRCGYYKDRPVQADNLHLDIWVKGINVLWDAGSYKYNTKEEELKYFNGTKSHNTIRIGNYDQMKKGARFIWNNWIKKAKGSIIEKEDAFIFEGEFCGFKELGNITHKRIVIKKKNKLEWVIKDSVEGKPEHELEINWHINPISENQIKIESSFNEKPLIWKKTNSYVSNYYGIKNESINLHNKVQGNKIKTKITF